MIFDSNVYNLSSYLPQHDKFMDIREWCGRDITEDFKTKVGAGRDHRESTYAMIERYNIGKIEEVEVSQDNVENGASNGYNLIIPLFVSLLGYWVPYFLIKKKVLNISQSKFNAFWNTILILSLLIPSFGFGVFMILRTKKPSLYDINFDFIYWHVELSVVMGITAISHFLQRWPIFRSQLK